MADPATSDWLKRLLETASARDPVDVMNDLENALQLVGNHVGELLAGDPFVAR